MGASISLEDTARHMLLNPYQRDLVERSVATNQRALRRLSAPFDGASDEPMWEAGDDMAPDPADVRESIRRDQQTLDRYSPLSYPLENAYAIKKAMDKVKELDELIREGMLSDNQMNNPTAEHIDIQMGWSDRCVNGQHPKYRGINLVLWRANLLRRLDPNNDDPNFVSVERIRPKTDVQRDWRSYRKNWDEIQFQLQDKVEAALEELDEDRFQRFCRYKAAEWAKVNIQRELGFDDSMYEAAMQRLKEIRDQIESHAQRDLGEAGGVDEASVASSDGPSAAAPPPPSHDRPPDRYATREEVAQLLHAIQSRGLVRNAVARAVQHHERDFMNMLNPHSNRRMSRELWQRCQDWLARYDRDHRIIEPFQKDNPFKKRAQAAR